MRAIIKLTKEEQKELEKVKKTEKSNKIYRRYLYLEMSNSGMTNLKISKFLGVCKDTLTDWKRIYEEGGLDGLSQLKYEGRRESKLKKHEQAIREKIEKDQVSSLKELQSFILETCKESVEQSWLSRYCKKNSIYLTKRLG